LRIGHGYDAHRLTVGRRLVLGGVEIPFEKGLLGHSDADVLVHAIMDALLGAAALGDIGKLFPDSNANFKDACSIKLLEKVYQRLEENGYSIVNIDCTVIAQSPKLAPFIEQMRWNIACALQADIGCVSIKATTEEGMGFTGTKEGMSAHAVCLIE
jgi:2-C-methyl-D-erythritol 2,4-cyclodiphosphate synthase